MNLLQSELWLNFQKNQGRSCIFEKNQRFQYLGIKESTFLGDYYYFPYGPVIFGKDNNEKITNFNSCLTKIRKKINNNVIFLRFEPQDRAILKILSKKPFKKTIDLNPPETWLLDLPETESDLKKLLPTRLFRYYKNHEKSGLEIKTSQNPADIHFLHSLQQNLASEKNIQVFSEKYLVAELEEPFSTLYLVSYNPEKAQKSSLQNQKSVQTPSKSVKNPKNSTNVPQNSAESSPKPQIVAAGLVFADNDTLYNLQGAQSALGRSLHATGILTIQLILDAWQKHLKIFDFWGIAPENAPKNHPWAGFSSFKRTFHGREVDYCGTYDFILNPQKYALYSSLRVLNRNLRKISPKKP